MTLKNVTRALAVAVAAAAGGGGFGVAEAQESGPTTTEETIVVTATRRSTDLQDTPLSVSALSGEQLEERGLVSVADAVQQTPGVSLTSNQPGTNEFIIRGVGTSTSYATLAGAITNATTATYLDQLPVTNTVQKTPDFRFIDLDRIEVLRGPQGTLYGQSAMGGVVRYITNRPSTEGLAGGFNAYSSITEDGGLNLGGDGYLNLALSDTLALRAVGYAYGNAGFIDVVGTAFDEDANNEETLGGRFALRWTPTNRFTVDLTALYNEVNLGSLQLISSTYPVDFNLFTPPVVTPVSTDTLEVEHLQPSEESASVLGVEFLYEFGGFNANLILAHRETDSDSTFESSEFVGVTDAYFGQRTIGNSENDTAEFRLTSTGDGNFIDWNVGVYYEDTGGQIGARAVAFGDPLLLSFFPHNNPPGGFVVPGDVVTDNGRQLDYQETSVFGELAFNLSSALSITIGARHADIDTNYQRTFANGTNDAAAASLVGVSQATSESVDTYRLNISYQASDDVLFYANAASGYRPGGFNPGVSFPVVIPDSAYVSDTLWNYEAGVRTSWLNNRLILNAAAYQIDWSDMQLATIDLATFYTATRNVGEAQINGLELEAFFRATDSLALSANYTYAKAEISEPTNLGFLVLAEGDRLPGTPEHAFTAFADWRSPVPDTEAEFVANATYRYVGDRIAVLGSPTEMDAYSLLDVRFGVEFASGVKLTLFADNVTNEIAVNQLTPTALPNFTYYNINRPRTIGVSARYDF
jgi:iron complex outermembrane receptor protein